MTVDTRTVVGRWEGLAATEMVWAVQAGGGRIVVEIDTADPLSAAPRPCVPAARVRATPEQLRALLRLAARVLEVVELREAEAAAGGAGKQSFGAEGLKNAAHTSGATATGGPGWPGPCPDGVTWERWLADNNVD
jgi:hypothetical protein